MCAFWDFKKRKYTQRDKNPTILIPRKRWSISDGFFVALSVMTTSTVKEKRAKPNSVAQMLPEVSSDIRDTTELEILQN